MTEDSTRWLEETEPGERPADLPFLALEDTFVSGDRTGRRFRIRYYHGDDKTRLRGKIVFGPGAQGPPDHVHGGAMAAVLDEAMGGVAWLSGHPVVAAHLDISFRRMLPLATPCVVETRVTAVEGRKISTEGVLRARDGDEVFAAGTALFIELAQRHLDGMRGKAGPIIERMRAQLDSRREEPE